jgi:hypothetical protein
MADPSITNNITDTPSLPPPGTFDVIMGVWIPAIICLLGIIGNALALIVLARDRHSVTFYSLKALSSTDLLLLVCAMLQQVIPMWCIINERRDTFCLNQGYVRVYTWPIICIAQMNSIWLTVLISAERFIAIIYPLRSVHTCTIRNLRMAVIIITVTSVIFNIPKFFEFVPDEDTDPVHNVTHIVMGPTHLRSDPVYRYFYNTALYCLVIYAFPLTILTMLNLKIVNKIKKARRNWESLNRHQKREMKATVLPLVIVLVFFISGTQAFSAFALDAVFVDFQPWLQVYTAIVNILVILNSALNFILMYVFGKKFRNMLRDTFPCTRRKKTLSPMSSGTFI